MLLDAATLRQRQSLPLEAKIVLSQRRIYDWYNHWGGDVYVAFSGGKDSSVLLHLVRECYPDVLAVFNNTGLEYPEVLTHVRETSNVTWLKPKYSFQECCDHWGYLAVSKEVSNKVYLIQHTKREDLRRFYLYGDDGNGRTTSFQLRKKWHRLLDAPFKISDLCCSYLKKYPAMAFEKQSGLYPFLGVIAAESSVREKEYLRFGCNSYDVKRPKSHPLGFWTEQDILNYIVKYNIKIPEVYGEIKEKDGELYCTQENRTGCVACPFGQEMECPNKFQRMAVQRPKLLSWILDDLHMRQVLDYTGVKYA